MGVSAFIYLIRPGHPGASIGFFAFLELVLLWKNFTHKITISNNDLVIDYYKWGVKRTMQLDIRQSTAEEVTVVGGRGSKYQAIKIYSQGRVRYTTSSEYDEGDLGVIVSAINDAQKATVTGPSNPASSNFPSN